MDINCLKKLLVWLIVINYAVLIIWFGAFVFAHEWLYGMHSQWFKLSRETFDALHYGGMAAYKVGVFLFNVSPLIALCLISPKKG